jgi:hypothetical protein
MTAADRILLLMSLGCGLREAVALARRDATVLAWYRYDPRTGRRTGFAATRSAAAKGRLRGERLAAVVVARADVSTRSRREPLYPMTGGQSNVKGAYHDAR